MPCPPPRDHPNPGIELRSPALQVDSLPSEPPEKPKNTGLVAYPFSRGSQGLNPHLLGLLHCQAGSLPAEPSGKSHKNYQKTTISLSSAAQSCLTLCNPMNCSTPGLPVHHQLLEITQTHVHRVSDAIQTSHSLSSPFPPVPIPSQHQKLFQ